MDSNSLPMAPDLDVFSSPVRFLVLTILGSGVLILVVLVLAGLASSPTVVLEATVVDAPSSDDEVYTLSEFSAESPVQTVAEKALRTGSGSVETTTEEMRSEEVPTDEFYVRHHGRVVRVSVAS